MFVAQLAAPSRADELSDYRYVGSFAVPAATSALDALPDGRLILLVGNDLHLESMPGRASFAFHGTLPAADFPSFGAAFLRVSPDGMRVAVGNNGGASFGNYQVGVFTLTPLSGTWFTANHFDGEWFDNTHVAITAGDFVNPSVVTMLDTTSLNPAAPVNPVVVGNIGGASGGIAFDSVGALFTGNGFQGSGPSGTGAVKAFAFSSWSPALSGGPAADFEASTTLVVDVLSASPLARDRFGNLWVGGGDFSSSTDSGFAALVAADVVSGALSGGPAADPTNPAQVRRLDPDAATAVNYYTVVDNAALHRVYLREGADADVHVYQNVAEVPVLSGWGLVGLAGAMLVCGTMLVARLAVLPGAPEKFQ